MSVQGYIDTVSDAQDAAFNRAKKIDGLTGIYFALPKATLQSLEQTIAQGTAPGDSQRPAVGLDVPELADVLAAGIQGVDPELAKDVALRMAKGVKASRFDAHRYSSLKDFDGLAISAFDIRYEIINRNGPTANLASNSVTAAQACIAKQVIEEIADAAEKADGETRDFLVAELYETVGKVRGTPNGGFYILSQAIGSDLDEGSLAQRIKPLMGKHVVNAWKKAISNNDFIEAFELVRGYAYHPYVNLGITSEDGDISHDSQVKRTQQGYVAQLAKLAAEERTNKTQNEWQSATGQLKTFIGVCIDQDSSNSIYSLTATEIAQALEKAGLPTEQFGITRTLCDRAGLPPVLGLKRGYKFG